MVIVNAQGEMVLVNSQAEKMFGYTRQEMLGQKVELLVPVPVREMHQRQVHDYFKAPTARPLGAGLNLTGRRKDGSVVAVEISLSPFTTAEGVLVSSAIRDVTCRNETEAKFARQNGWPRSVK